MTPSTANSSDQPPDTNPHLRRWAGLAIASMLISSVASHSIHRSIGIFIIYAIAIPLSAFLLSYPFHSMLIRYVQAFEQHSKTLIYSLAVLLGIAATILFLYMIYFFQHPGMHLDNLSVSACIPSWISIALFAFTSIELAYCEHIQTRCRQKN